jgi:predicted Zn finger-like uncharacterized protein
MIVVCPTCQARYRFDESKLGDRPKVKTRCAKCSGVIEIVQPDPLDATMAPGTKHPAPAAPERHEEEPKQGTQKIPIVESDTDPGKLTGHDIQALLALPKNRRFSLAIIQGAATGQIFQISKVRTTLGRTGADLNLDDTEASRQHAVLEILGEHAILRDLDSTNGTFVDSARIEQQVLTNQMEFRIGNHVLMFIVTATD